jgi:hypothetical protein
MGRRIKRCLKFCREHPRAVLAVLVTSIAGIAIVLQLSGGPEKFPHRSVAGIRIHQPPLLDQILPSAPRQPSVPGLAVHEPTQIPGLSEVAWAKSPTMSADLLTIVFVAVNPRGSGDDLWIAERDSVESPFSRPVPIRSVNSKDKETHPSLTPDGLGLSYIRMSRPFEWKVSTRKTRADEFPEPVVIEVGELIEPTFQIDYVYQTSHTQGVLMARDSVFSAEPTDVTESKCLFYRRNNSAVLSLDRVPIANPWPRYICSGDRTRFYFADAQGLHVAGRASPNSEFLLPQQVVGSDTLQGDPNRFDSAIWLSRSEDMIIYCAASPENAGDNLLWMMRLR